MERIGRYKIENELGRGAFGRVYRAFDPNLKLHVAIKVLSDDDPELLSRFQAEASTNAALLHKNIVTVYGFSEQESPPYLVMEFLDGESLQDLIGRPLGILDKVEIMHQVAEGLQHAHAHNVVHRDMKPANIMVLADGTAKILDFGIARLLDQDGARRSMQLGITGTIPYLAPEQFRNQSADKLTDIWAYGVIYYELLTGTPLFHAEDTGTVMYRVTTYEPPPLREAVPDAPAALEQLLQRLLSKERELRVEKMEDVILDSQPVLQQLRQERAEAIASEIRSKVEAGDFETAKKQIDQILKLDPNHREARRWREQRQLQMHGKAFRARAASVGSPAPAIDYLEVAKKLDPGGVEAKPQEDEAARLRRERRKLELEREHREYVLGLDRILVEAMILLENRRPSEAVVLLENALFRYPADREVAALLERARQKVVAQRPKVDRTRFLPPKPVLMAAAAVLGFGLIVTLVWLNFLKDH